LVCALGESSKPLIANRHIDNTTHAHAFVMESEALTNLSEKPTANFPATVRARGERIEKIWNQARKQKIRPLSASDPQARTRVQRIVDLTYPTLSQRARGEYARTVTLLLFQEDQT
jgi:hypothetical protein